MNVDSTYFTDRLGACLSHSDHAVLSRGTYGQTRGLGYAPALVLVDFQGAYLGEDTAIEKQIAKYPAGGGSNAWRAMRASLPVLAAARGSRAPVVLTRIAYAEGEERKSVFAAKRSAADAFVDGQPGTLLAEELPTTSGDVVITKTAASAFFGTDLHERLQSLEIDTLLVGGLSTSGCVRATVVDAASFGYRVAVLADATADRIELSQHVSMLDMWMKYADVIAAEQGIAYLKQVGPDRPAQELG